MGNINGDVNVQQISNPESNASPIPPCTVFIRQGLARVEKVVFRMTRVKAALKSLARHACRDVRRR